MSIKNNFRGFKKINMISVLEGNGNTIPYREVMYFF